MVNSWQRPEVREAIWRKQRGQCYYGYSGVCKIHLVDGPTDRNWTIDHLHSQHRYPHLADDPSNWVGACRSCNSSKGQHSVGSAPARDRDDTADRERALRILLEEKRREQEARHLEQARREQEARRQAQARREREAYEQALRRERSRRERDVEEHLARALMTQMSFRSSSGGGGGRDRICQRCRREFYSASGTSSRCPSCR